MSNKKHSLWWHIATWFGSGHAPIASGTAGSLAALPFAWIIQTSFGNFALLFASVAMFFAGWWASNQYLKFNGGDDPREIVVDEVAGQWLLLSVMVPTWQAYFFGFLLFRVFDVVKPWPVSLADQKIEGGLGVMADDMLAAMYPIIIFMLLSFAAPSLVTPIINFVGGSYVH